MSHSNVAEHPLNYRAGLARRCFQLAFVLLLVGLLPALLAIWGQERAAASAAWHDPTDHILPKAIASDLAVLSLAGVPDDQVLALVMAKGELETAHALLSLSPNLTDAQRMDGWLWLAYRWERAGQPARAAQAYRLAGTGAVLSPDLPDLLRTDTLVSVAQQLTALHDGRSARFYLQQAAVIGAHAPHISSYHRRALLEQVVPVIVRAGGARADWSSLAKAIKTGRAAGGYAAVARPDAESDEYDALAASQPELLAARDARHAATAAWLATLSSVPNEANGLSEADLVHAEEEAQQALRQALLAEDTAVYQHVEQIAASSGTRLDAQEILVRWLLLKRRVAAGGFGLGVVPDWEADAHKITAALSAAWTDLLALQVAPSPATRAGSLQSLAAETAQHAMLAAYWGLYPDAPVNDLVPAAQAASGVGHLHLTVFEAGKPPLIGWSE